MAQNSKGNRGQVAPRVPTPVLTELQRRADEAEMYLSQYIADRLCELVRMPELVENTLKPASQRKNNKQQQQLTLGRLNSMQAKAS